MKLKGKMLLMLCLPVFGVLALSGYMLPEKWQQMREVREIHDASETGFRASALVHELLDQRRADARRSAGDEHGAVLQAGIAGVG